MIPSFGGKYCSQWDLNPHESPHRNLNPACLPIPPWLHVHLSYYIRPRYVKYLPHMHFLTHKAKSR